MDRPIIFGVGLHKTATMSMTVALRMLGWDVIHSNVIVDRMLMEEQKAGHPPLSHFVGKVNAFFDHPIPDIWPDLTKHYKRAKWILTTREWEPWIESREWHVSPDKRGWGIDREKIRQRYDEHHAEVRKFFDGNPDFLEMDITQGDGWDALCPFLGVEKPAYQFPKVNERKAFDFHDGRFTAHRDILTKQLEPFLDNERHILEVGSHEGEATCWHLINVCAHPKSTITTVDEHSSWMREMRFDHNVSVSENSYKVRKLKGEPRTVVPTLPDERFDIAYIDHGGSDRDFLRNLLIAWPKVKPGGLLVANYAADHFWHKAWDTWYDMHRTEIDKQRCQWTEHATCIVRKVSQPVLESQQDAPQSGDRVRHQFA
jgi:hypothetical protein